MKFITAPLLMIMLLASACAEPASDTSLRDTGAAGQSYAGDLKVSLAHPYDLKKDDFELLLAAPRSVSSMAVCEVQDAATTCAPGTPQMFSAAVIYATAERVFFKVRASALLEKGLVLRLIAYDAAGAVVDARTIEFGDDGAIVPVPPSPQPNNPSNPTDRTVTFSADILPVLSSNSPGRAYKCTTCHAHYAQADGLNNVAEVTRIIDSLEKGRMPRGGDPVPAATIALFRTWRSQGFKTGGANLTDSDSVRADPATPGSTATLAKINADRDIVSSRGRGEPYKAAPANYDAQMASTYAEAHRAVKGAGYRYIYLPADAVSDKERANVLRIAAAKAWNHLSWKADLDIPEDVSGGAGLVFALNAEKVWGADAAKNWGYLANCSAKANIQISPAPRGDCATFPADQPVAIPRFVYNATNGGPYANVHKTPTSFSTFTRKFDLSKIEHVSTHKEAIVCGPRITAYRTVTVEGQQLLYSYSSDEFNGRDNGSIRYKSAPTDRDQRGTGALNAGPGDGNTAIASEWWIQLPNGFMYYGIHGEGSQERGKAEFPFAIDPANWKQGSTLATGRSCITCHAAGIQSAPSDAAFAGKDGWSSNEELTKLYGGTRKKFQESMGKLVAELSDGNDDLNQRLVAGTIEPVSRALMEIEGRYTGNGGTGTCRSFCGGKFSERRLNFCATLPAR